ncbi:hypothetical protein [Kutzneria sp. NPDC052558]|uniref:hypothetical protein n=1 Tax=Kutzneria sp. NPDC052558 TaxID=3364121 RepID=UPI0037CC045E
MSLDFTFEQVPQFVEVVKVVRKSGGGFVAHNRISFMKNTEIDAYDWQTASPAAEASILAMLEEKAAAKIEVGISVAWKGSGHGGTLHIQPESRRIFIIPYADSPQVAPGFIGLGWYLDRLTADFAPFGLLSVEASDIP